MRRGRVGGLSNRQCVCMWREFLRDRETRWTRLKTREAAAHLTLPAVWGHPRTSYHLRLLAVLLANDAGGVQRAEAVAACPDLA